MYEKYYKKSGFTMVELLIVLAIFSILTLFSYPVYSKFYLLTFSKNNLAEIENLLKIARQKSFASYNNSSFGAYLDVVKSSFIFYEGDSFSQRDETKDLVFNFGESLQLVFPTEDIDINFTKRYGLPAKNYSFLFDTKNGKQKTLIISKFANIYIE